MKIGSVCDTSADFINFGTVFLIQNMASEKKLKDGDFCRVTAGTHKGKSGFVRDINTSKTGHVTITVEQENGVRFKTLGRNVEIEERGV